MEEKIFEKEGTFLKLEGNSPLLLSERENIWVVHSGKVDVFLVQVQKGKPVGSRTHLFRAEEGDALLGMDLTRYGRGFGLLACGITGTQLLELKKSGVSRLAKEPVYREKVAALIDSWISGLSPGLSMEMPPKQFVVLEAGKEISVEESSSSRPEKGVVWIKQLEGTSHFTGNEEFSLAVEDKLTPVSNQSWLRSAGKSKLHVINTMTLMEKDPSWSNLEEFHSLVINCLLLNKERAEREEQKRLRAKAKSAQVDLSNAFSRLTSILRPGPSTPVASGEGDALFRACSLIGNVLGIAVKEHPDAKKGKKQKDPLRAIALVSRIRLRKVILRDDWWRRDNGPLLAFIKENNRPVALLPVSATSYELHDPVERTKTVVTAEIASGLDPFAYTFYRPFPEGILKAVGLFKIGMHGCGRDLTTVILLGITGALLGLLTPVATGMIFDDIIPNAERGQLFQIALILFATTFAAGVFSLTSAIAMLRMEGRMDTSVQAGVWDRLMSLPASFFRNYSAGDLTKRAMGISEIRTILSGTTVQSVLHSIFSIFSLALLFYYSWKLALAAVGLVLFGFIFTGTYGYLQVRYQRGLVHIQGKIAGMVLQFVDGISKLRVAGAENRAFNIWAGEFSKQKEVRFKVGSMANVVASFNSMFPVVCSMLIFYMLIRFNRGALKHCQRLILLSPSLVT
jgi:hypothetical protein